MLNLGSGRQTRPEVKLQRLATIKGELITDFLQMDLKSRFLICYSNNQTILTKLPILERLIEHFRVKFNIEFADPIELPKKKGNDPIDRFNARASLRRAVNMLRNDPERAGPQYNIKSPINCFLDRLKV